MNKFPIKSVAGRATLAVACLVGGLALAFTLSRGPAPAPVALLDPAPMPAPADEHAAVAALVTQDSASLYVAPGQVVELPAGEHVHGDILNQGTLRLLPGCRLKVHTLLNLHSRFECGTADSPIPLDNPVEITIRDMGPLDPAKDPYQLGRGIIFHGPTRIYGERKDKRLASDMDPDPEVDAKNQVCSVTIRSENPAARGHVMFMMNADVVINYCAAVDMGRTRKDIPVTDAPLYLGNVRGRYSFHFHHCPQSTPAAPMQIRGLYVKGSPGLGIVVHQSDADLRDCITYDCFGAGFFQESGNECGTWENNYAAKSTGVVTTLALNDGRGLKPDGTPLLDFGHQGHGFWLHGGGISLHNNLASGHNKAIAILGNAGEQGATFGIGRLRDGIGKLFDPKWVGGGLPPGQMFILDVPLDLSGNKVRNSTEALVVYGMHNPTHQVSNLKDPSGNVYKSRIFNEDYQGHVSFGYDGHLHLKGVKVDSGTATPLNDNNHCGIDHSGIGFGWVIEDVTVSGYKWGMRCPTMGDNVVIGGHMDCEVGYLIEQASHPTRTLKFDGAQTFGPRTKIGYCMSMTYFRFPIDWMKAKTTKPGTPYYDPFWRCDPKDGHIPIHANDEVFVGNERLAHEELGDAYSLAELLAIPPDVRLKPDGTPRTVAEVRADKGLVVCGRVLPADQYHKPGHRGWFHSGPAVLVK